jgi:hypothetical protein
MIKESNHGTFGDQWQPMTIRLNLNIGIGYRCHQVADIDFAVGDQKCIMPTMLTHAYQCLPMLTDGEPMVADKTNGILYDQC